MRSHFHCALQALGIVAAIMLMSGCGTTAMKGTPFYTGEYEKRQGAAAERVNLWPLFYYRDPALSFLWPLGEVSDDRLALRPLFSIEERQAAKPVYNVLWPLGRFDRANRRHRFFPFFWGEDYRIIFPLYGHKGEPFKKTGKGHDTLLPIWHFEREQEDYSLHLLPPIFNVRSFKHNYDPSACGWRLWPLLGRYHSYDNTRGKSFTLWPLGSHTWNTRSKEESWRLLPLFYKYRHEGQAHGFHSLMGGWERDATDNRLEWYSPPLLSWGSETAGESHTRVLLGLYGRERSSVNNKHWLFPFYFTERGVNERLTLSPLYCAGSAQPYQDNHWWSVPPLLVLRKRDNGSDSFYSLPYSYKNNRAAEHNWSLLTPLYYRSHTPEGGSFITLLGGWRHDKNSRKWMVYPLLSGGKRDADGGEVWLGGPLYHSKWDSAGSLHWLLPLYCRNNYDNSFYSLPYCHWREGGIQTWLIPPLLTARSVQPGQRDLWLLAGLGHFSSGENAQSSHLLPLYYRDNEMFLTLPYGKIKTGKQVTRYWLTPLVGTYSGEERGGWLFPFYNYTHNPQQNNTHASFLLLGEMIRSPHHNETSFPLLLKHRSVSNETSASYQLNLLLLFARKTSERQVTSRPQIKTPGDHQAAGRGVEKQSSVRLFPLWSSRLKERHGGEWARSSGNLLLMLYDYKHEVGNEIGGAVKEHDYLRRRVLYRLYHHERLNGVTATDIFPAITIDRDPQAGKRKIALLWRLFRYERTPESKAIDLLFIPLQRKKSAPAADGAAQRP